MGELVRHLTRYERSFPIGLSGITGMGYLLTGGISPLSRSQGLAIDQLTKIEGVWGSGESFQLSYPNQNSNKKEILEWKALCGAAPFLGIITKVCLKTFDRKPILIWDAIVTPSKLAESIYQSENWPNIASLQWFWGEKIRLIAIYEKNHINSEQEFLSLINKIDSSSKHRIQEIKSIDLLQNILVNKSPTKISQINHSEVLSIIGSRWQNHAYKAVRIVERLMNDRPHKSCYIAAQQLGGKVSTKNKLDTSFIHRDAIWKPWITGSWPSGDKVLRQKSLAWMKTSWEELQFLCPNVHLAQIHPHLAWHSKEIESAFGELLPILKRIKLERDPNFILPNF